MTVAYISSNNGSQSATRTPGTGMTYSSWTPVAGDMVLLWAASTAVSAITTPSGWVNVLGGNTVVASDAHSMCCVYHIVTPAEQAATTITYPCTNLWNATVTGGCVGLVFRNVDPANLVDSSASTFDSGNTVTPHVLVGLTGTNLSAGSLVVSGVSKDGTGTYTDPTGWNTRTFNNTNQAIYALARIAVATAGGNVAATNITPSAGDEYASITVALGDWSYNSAQFF